MEKRAKKGLPTPESQATSTATGTTLEAPKEPTSPQRKQPKKRKPKK